MARKLDKQKALLMRKQGMSYSQIKEKLGVSKSTLSGWLYDMPLSEKRIRELQADSPIRIEKYRNTMRAKREVKLLEAYTKATKDIKKLSKREMFLAGLFLYWGEGSKTRTAASALSNTDPAVLVFYIKWLKNFGVKKENLKVKLQLYKDMNAKDLTKYWSDKLCLPASSFNKPYIKDSKFSGLTYKNGFGYGTCMVWVANRPLNDYILMSIKRLQDINIHP
jgi:transcriptional regulator with XRE-family HTH domain